MSEKIYSRIEEIDREAERLIGEAKIKAKQILEDAQRASDEILSGELAVDDIRGEQDKIIRAAQEEASKQVEEASKQVEEAKQKALDLKKRSLSKADEVLKMIVNGVIRIS
jgi:cell division septum initiation protein DivIVA